MKTAQKKGPFVLRLRGFREENEHALEGEVASSRKNTWRKKMEQKDPHRYRNVTEQEALTARSRRMMHREYLRRPENVEKLKAERARNARRMKQYREEKKEEKKDKSDHCRSADLDAVQKNKDKSDRRGPRADLDAIKIQRKKWAETKRKRRAKLTSCERSEVNRKRREKAAQERARRAMEL